ncbi:hypothetical protein DO97_02890 [Neosynechococcus sphagnicola sy1]|uniref:Uncharacterized protein n=1 Tax=Neosynechococcus sphagnicola sy1 TaxID=1497020 RepID=A0A098TQA5_9CYAN|nr:hypothetical protein [Neosynechococcus sphagnicola]KGF73008.1 hypothetical protein DO97_02890 [Neosynechococcus sphagnicola sy1]
MPFSIYLPLAIHHGFTAIYPINSEPLARGCPRSIYQHLSAKLLGFIRGQLMLMLFLALSMGERIAGLLGVFLSIPIAGIIALWMRSAPEKATLLLEAAPETVVEQRDGQT